MPGLPYLQSWRKIQGSRPIGLPSGQTHLSDIDERCYRSACQMPKPFDAELTHQQVIDLAQKAEKAKRKLEVLRQSIESWLPGRMPDLPLTRITRREPSDV